MSRKTHLYRAASPSISERNRYVKQLERVAFVAEAVAISLIKANGSSLKPNEWSVIIPSNDENLAKPWDRLHVADGPNNELVATVSVDPDMAAQIEAFKAELAEASKPVEATSEPLIVLEQS